MAIDPVSEAVESTIGGLFEVGKMAISRIWPDPVKQAEEERKLAQLVQDGDIARVRMNIDLLLGQLDINKAEAQHTSIFVAGARPFIIWVGGIALAWQFVIYPIFIWAWAIAEVNGFVPSGVSYPPTLEAGPLFALISGLLGVAGMRSYDKTKGTVTNNLN